MSGELPSDVNPYQIEPQLSAYAPRPPRIDRDRLMFEAGRAAAVSHPAANAALALRPGVIAWFPPPTQPAAPGGWFWPASTLSLALVAIGLGVALVVRPAPLERVHVVRIPTHSPAATVAVSSGGLVHQKQDLSQQPMVEQETPIIALESLPEDHLLRVRQSALTDGGSTMDRPSSRHTTRLAPPPTRGVLMRQLAGSRPAAANPSPAVFPWSHWLRQP